MKVKKKRRKAYEIVVERVVASVATSASARAYRSSKKKQKSIQHEKKSTFGMQYIGVGRNFDDKSQVRRKRKRDNGQVHTAQLKVVGKYVHGN